VVFTIPGWTMLLAGLAITLPVLSGPFAVGGRLVDFHYLFYSLPLVIMGYQALWFDKVEEYFVRFAGYLPHDLRRPGPVRPFRLELWLIIGVLLMALGVGLLGWIILRWAMTGYGELSKIRLGAAAMLVLIMGMQTIMNAMVISMMDIKVDRR
jgi:hypothetical protein